MKYIIIILDTLINTSMLLILSLINTIGILGLYYKISPITISIETIILVMTIPAILITLKDFKTDIKDDLT